MNEGKGLETLASEITLPDHLASKIYLKEFYGKVSWSVKAYATGTLGWFDGNPTNLNKQAPSEEAKNFAKLAGGEDSLLQAARQALEAEDYQWAMELSDRLLTLGIADGRVIKIASMRAMADLEINATARNYYLLYAKEMEG